jgi:hypothetical protein
MLLSLTACGSLRAYDHAALGEMPAHINGDYRVSAGTVDDQPLRFWQNGADVLDGEHRLLIDCQVTPGEHLSRHELKVRVAAGVTYRLRAEATSQSGCSNVYMEETRL